MSAATAPLPRMLLAQVAAELRMRARVPAFSVTTLALPVVFFMFFGLPVAALRAADGSSIGARVLVSFGAFAVGSVIKVRAKRVLQTDDGVASFDCAIDDESGRLGGATVTVYQPADVEKFFDGSSA